MTKMTIASETVTCIHHYEVASADVVTSKRLPARCIKCGHYKEFPRNIEYKAYRRYGRPIDDSQKEDEDED